MDNKKLFWKGVKNGIPIFLGYLAVSFSFGITARASGLEPLDAIIMSATNLTSAGQFASLSIIAGGLSYIELAISQLVINLRYALMSSTLSQKFSEKMPLIHRFLIAYGNTDEIFALMSTYDGAVPPAYCYGLIAISWPGWVGGTALGVLMGSILPTNILNALGIILYAMFLAIILPSARKERRIGLIIAISMVASTIFTYVPGLREISSGFRIIILTVVISAVCALVWPRKEESEGETI